MGGRTGSWELRAGGATRNEAAASRRPRDFLAALPFWFN